MTEWTAQVNDLVGGWIVTTYPHPLSEHDTRPDGDPTKRGMIAAECPTEVMAGRLAGFLNGSTVEQALVEYRKYVALNREADATFVRYWTLRKELSVDDLRTLQAKIMGVYAE